MRCLFTLLAMLMLIAGGASAQSPLPIDTNTIGMQIPERKFEDHCNHPPTMMMNYSYSSGLPSRVLRLRYHPTTPFTKDTLLLDYVPTNPSQTSQFYRQITRPVDPWDLQTPWTPIGWVRADLDADGRVIRLWGEDVLGRYWVWQGSLPFTVTTIPDAVVPKAEVD